MSSSLFSIARTALITQQRVMTTVSQNIANAETPGYTRQEAVLTASTPIRMSFGMMGAGVEISAVVRKRDLLLDESFRNVSATAGEANLRRDNLTGVQNIFGEPSDAGMSNALDQFWNSWSELATTPSSQANRGVVQQRGSQVAQLFHSYDDSLTLQRTSILDRLTTTIAGINASATQVADLNNQIASSEIGGVEANDLRDRRDMLVDSLALAAGARGIQQTDGSMTVMVGNSTLVDSTTARPLSLFFVTPNPPPASPTPDVPVSIRLGDSIDSLKPLGGQLKAMAASINVEVPGIRARLDKLASALAASVNAIHTQGFTFAGGFAPGTAAGNFFDPGSVGNPVSAASFQLSLAVAGDVDAIAASQDANAPLDNRIATQLAALRNEPGTVTYTQGITTETGSFLGFFRSMVTRLGLDVHNADDDATVSGILLEQADDRRQSVSGVNSDEELIHLVRVQQAYVAATKLIKAADEMLQTVLTLI